MSSIRLFWWCEPYFMKKSKENYGDVLGKYLVEKISGNKVYFVNPRQWSIKNLWSPVYATAGSILAHVNKHCVVWGSGIIKTDERVERAKFLAVRGPETRTNLIKQGYTVPDIYGDPALLMPLYYTPTIVKKFKLGIIPHYTDYQLIRERYEDDDGICIIDLMTNDVERTTEQILSCEYLVSSSLHGLIIGHAYRIPSLWVEFSDRLFGDGVKFIDYFKSVGVEVYKPLRIEKYYSQSQLIRFFQDLEVLPELEVIESLQKGLMKVCPFKRN